MTRPGPVTGHPSAPFWKGSLLPKETLPGFLLLFATAVALVWANTPWEALYRSSLAWTLTLGVGDLSISKPLLLWINDGLMAVFFLVVGLEIKAELVDGELSSLRKAALPLAAAFGGVLVPALLYTAFNAGGEGARGWGIPMATDIAFALGVLAVVGSRAPVALKVFLTAVAVVDDLVAVAVIALFYTAEVHLMALGVGAATLLVLVGLNRAGVRSLVPYLLLGSILWIAVLKSGVHATVAGVLLAFVIPATRRDGSSPLVRLEHGLHPWTVYLIVPVFALANAGVRVVGDAGVSFANPVTLGVMVGLMVGKPLGILGMAWVAIRMGWADRPAGVTWGHLTGAGLLAGIGFTMSLFVGQLAFGAGPILEASKVGILAASAVSGTAAWAVFRWVEAREARARSTAPFPPESSRTAVALGD